MIQKQVLELSHQLTKMKKRKLEEHGESDHELIANFENMFQRYGHNKQLLDRDEYHRDFSNPIYIEINVE